MTQGLGENDRGARFRANILYRVSIRTANGGCPIVQLDLLNRVPSQALVRVVVVWNCKISFVTVSEQRKEVRETQKVERAVI